MRIEFLIVRKCLGLALMLSLVWLGPGLRAEEPRQDWSRVQALPADQKIVVKSFKGMGPKVKGVYVSSDADRLIVRKQNGQAVTIPKDQIRRVVQKGRIRHAGLIGAAAGFAIGAGLSTTGGFRQPLGALLIGGAFAGIGALIGFAVQVGGRHFVVYQAENQAPRASTTP